jgi:serine acetyltransferase
VALTARKRDSWALKRSIRRGLRLTWLRLKCDLEANVGNTKGRVFCVAFRTLEFLRITPGLGVLSIVADALYTLFVRWILCIDIPAKTRICGGFRIYHGFGVVIHEKAKIYRGVGIRHLVTIGERRPSAGVPTICRNVEIGTGAIIIGRSNIGHHATIGAGAIVVNDIPPHAVVVGVLAKIMGSI